MGRDRSTLDLYRWKHIRRAVAERARFHCQCCGQYLGMRGQADHIVPRSECEAEGIHPEDLANLQWLCPSCHSRKTNLELWKDHVPRDRSLPPRKRAAGRSAYHDAVRNFANVCTTDPEPQSVEKEP